MASNIQLYDSLGSPVALSGDALSAFLSLGSGTLAKAWVNFNGTGTVAIRDSLNVSSLTDIAVGEIQVNFTTPFADVNYAVGASQSRTDTPIQTYVGQVYQRTTTSLRYGESTYDQEMVGLVIFR